MNGPSASMAFTSTKGLRVAGGNNCPGNNLENLKPVADDQLLKFTQDRQVRHADWPRNQSKGNADTANFIVRPTSRSMRRPTSCS